MEFFTLAEIKSEVEKSLDLEDETFVVPGELTNYINAGIREATAEILNTWEDYFLSKEVITLEEGVEEYELPESMYAHKIRSVVFGDGTESYKLRRTNYKQFLNYTEQKRNPTWTDDYQYVVYNKVPGSPKLLLMPASRVNGDYLTIWFIRAANKLVDDADVCDIPEFVDFVIKSAKLQCYAKEVHPNISIAAGDLNQERLLMKQTLSTMMMPDEDTEIEMDLSSYEEQTA